MGIPAFNEERYIEEAIASVVAQTRAADEILVFDNASTDGTDRIAAALLPPTSVRRAPRNVGAAENFNRAVRECSGEYFAWLSADDCLMPGYLATTSQLLDAEPEVEAAFVFVDYVDNDGTVLYSDRTAGLNNSDLRRRVRSYLRRVRWCEVYSLYRRDSLLASPMFSATYGGDVLLSWWFVLRGTIRVIEQPLLRKRVDDRDRSDVAIAAGIGVSSRTRGRPRAGLWRALWRASGRDGIPRRATRAARRELVLALFSRSWLQSFAADYVSVDRQARLRAAIERVRGRPFSQDLDR